MYSTTWYHLDKNNKVLCEYRNKACFAPIKTKNCLEKDLHYLLYDFSNMMVTQEEATKYFLFLKSIPIFKKLMPRSCTQMAKDKQYKIDIHKFNGTQIFTILTLIRAVVEDPDIVRTVIKFNRKHTYSISNFSILKLCGSVRQKNSNHWITGTVDKDNLEKVFNTETHWESTKPFLETGLGSNLFNTFQCYGDGYAPLNPVSRNDIVRVLQETKKKRIVQKKVQYDNSTLQLGF